MLNVILLGFGLFQIAYASRLNLYHRILVPSNPSLSSKYSYKGYVDLETLPVSSLQALYTPSNDLNREFTSLLGVVETDSSALYQVALELPDVAVELWPMSSVKACHLHHAKSERIWLHTSSASSHDPHSITYWILETPDDGLCRTVPSSSSSGLDGHKHPNRVLDMPSWNTTVLVKSPSSPLLAQLRVPPPLTPEGKPVQPEVEKTFIQKYWMHIAGAFLLISLFAPAPEEGTEGGNSGAGAPAAR